MNDIASLPPADLTLENLYRTYRTAVFRICLGYVRSHEDAHDLVQETFVKAHLGLSGFEGRSQAKTWLIRIAINQCLTRKISEKRAQRNLDAFQVAVATEMEEEREDQVVSRLGMEEVLKQADAITRKILLLSFQEGLTHSEIAKTLGVSRVAVTRRITRFRKNTGSPLKIKARAKARVKPAASLSPVRSGEWMREPAPMRRNPAQRDLALA